jgi:hypothetical protein
VSPREFIVNPDCEADGTSSWCEERGCKVDISSLNREDELSPNGFGSGNDMAVDALSFSVNARNLGLRRNSNKLPS